MPHSSSRRGSCWEKRLVPACSAVLILAALASGCSEREDTGAQTTERATAEPTGRELFVDYCAPCHGADGSGNGPLASELRVAPTNLRLLKQANNGKFPTLQIQRSIDGRAMPRSHGLPDMPVWGRLWLRQGLGDAEAQARALTIASYIGTIQD